jgi:tRNA threonylcarbamoyladenosine biosynthesis protein TsaE
VGTVICLSGTLGSGKTVLAKGIARGLGVLEPVTSPTYTIISEYEGRLRLLHVDLYRIGGAEEFVQLGIDDELDDRTVVLIEWPERAETALPTDAPQISITITGTTARQIDVPGRLMREVP